VRDGVLLFVLEHVLGSCCLCLSTRWSLRLLLVLLRSTSASSRLMAYGMLVKSNFNRTTYLRDQTQPTTQNEQSKLILPN
jgi:hypothetical protein